MSQKLQGAAALCAYIFKQGKTNGHFRALQTRAAVDHGALKLVERLSAAEEAGWVVQEGPFVQLTASGIYIAKLNAGLIAGQRTDHFEADFNATFGADRAVPPGTAQGSDA